MTKHDPTAVAITGHRPLHFSFGYDETHPACMELQAKMYMALHSLCKNGMVNFYCGMAQGVDLWAARMLLSLKCQYPSVNLIAAIPFPGQADRWGEQSRANYNDILSQIDTRIIIETHYTKHCMFKRNRYMVDHANTLLAVFDGSKGGTAYTVSYAHQLNRTIHIINPTQIFKK